jgi:SAM-dependent methyltransferase
MQDYWETRYGAGHLQRYPWDMVVSFVFQSAPPDRPRKDVSILEVGFGTGANLLFAAREGFRVAGIERSRTAVKVARERFAAEGLAGELQEGSFTALPFADAAFDLIVDRASLTCAELSDIRLAIGEIHRVAKPGARFLFNPYADSHSSLEGHMPAGSAPIAKGTLAGVDRITFLSRSDVIGLFQQGWRIASMKRLEIVEMQSAGRDLHAEWRVIAVKA